MSETQTPEAGDLAEAEPHPEAVEITVYVYELHDKRWLATVVRGDVIRNAVGRDEPELKRFLTSALIGEFRLTQEQVDKLEVDVVHLEAAKKPAAKAQPEAPAAPPPAQQAARPTTHPPQQPSRPGMKA